MKCIFDIDGFWGPTDDDAYMNKQRQVLVFEKVGVR